MNTDDRKRVVVSTLGIAVAATITATAGFAASAHADPNIEFQSPSGNITCVMLFFNGTNTANCQIHDFTYQIQRDCPASMGAGWHQGDNWHLDQGNPNLPYTQCHNGQNVSQPFTLDYGQTRSHGALICTSEPSAMRCTDNSTGHFFTLSRESYQLG
jgi:hypothetical protein